MQERHSEKGAEDQISYYQKDFQTNLMKPPHDPEYCLKIKELHLNFMNAPYVILSKYFQKRGVFANISRIVILKTRTCSGSWNLDLPSLLTSLIPSHQLQLPIYWKLTLKDWLAAISPTSTNPFTITM